MIDFFAELAREYAALLVSICALFLTINQSMATRRHNRLSVTPHLTSFTDHKRDSENSDLRVITFTLTNNGLGPAIIDRYELLQDRKVIDDLSPDNLVKIATKVLPIAILADCCYFSVLRKGYVLAKDEVITVAKIKYAPTIHDDPKKLDEALQSFHIRVTFESIYRKSFSYDSRDHFTQE